jgi:ATP-binding protein involved in chromosome partitioning
MERDADRVNSPVFVQEIKQKNNFEFTIQWSDGLVSHYRLSDLQKQCPCAGCVDEVTGKRLFNEKAVKDDVRALNIKNVGRYALKIQYTSGCSSGIYSFDFLRQIANQRRLYVNGKDE